MGDVLFSIGFSSATESVVSSKFAKIKDIRVNFVPKTTLKAV